MIKKERVATFDSVYFTKPEQKIPDFMPGRADAAFLHQLEVAIRSGNNSVDNDVLDELFVQTGFPKHYKRLILVLYAPGHKRILVSREVSKTGKFSSVFQRLLAHSRCALMASQPFRLQMDFLLEPALPVDFYAVGMEQSGENHFEIGIDGLVISGVDKKPQFFLPGDAYVRSIMAMGQLRDYMKRAFGEEYLRQAEFKRFRSESYLSGKKTWLRLYRGYPVVGAISKNKIEHAVELAIAHIQTTQEANGKFLYYYDSASDTRRDHEHPKRDLAKNPYYNILRHCGGALTCIYYEKYSRQGKTLDNICRAIDYLIAQARVQDYGGRDGAYIYSEKKSKLGGTGIALYLLADYQVLTGDDRYRLWADRFAWHLLNQITASGEFIYYNIYLDKPVSEAENQDYFSFFYPGEAVCGLAKYLHLVDAENREIFFEKLRKALEFLLVVRPKTRASEYSEVPSDGWLMMGIMELWDFEEMRDPIYADFVFSDAGQMIEHMYKVTDAPYPDYAGAFYYNFGDYPYADGARCEGLLGAYELAVKMGDREQVRQIWPALCLAAWAVMHLVNTEDAIYSAKNPAIALGGIRFKYTRQWFRIDTIQHVASFFAKMLPYWDSIESQPIEQTNTQYSQSYIQINRENSMRILKKFDKNQLFRFFVDGRFHKKYEGWVGYEAGERGSVQALLNGFSFMMDHFDLTTGLEPNYLLDLHKVCMMGVQTKNLKTSPGDLRFLNAGMPYLANTTTLENIREILTMRMGDGTAVFNTAAYAKPAEMLDAEDVYQAILHHGKLNYRNWYPNLSKEDTNALEKKSGLKAFYEAKHRVQMQFADKVETIVGRFNADMLDAPTQEARLRSIALLIRELELLHPFPDGNCRTFACVLLTQLLLNYGFTPAILKNPNLDGECSLAQWIEEIQIGMGITESLLENPQARVYNYSIEDAKPEDIQSFSEMAKELVQKIESYHEIFLTPQRLKAYTQGQWLVPCPEFMRFSGVGTYNTYSKGNVYFALELAKWIKEGKDIRQELTRVLSKGIKALVTDHVEYGDGWDIPVLLVDDAFAAFKAAAVQTRIDLNPFTILITGTEGKSGAKVQLQHLLSFQAQAHGVRNSANTEVPVLRSLINLSADEKVEINEVSVGSDEAYRVERTRMVSPNLCLFTNIGPNHMDMHKTMENVLRAKSSVVEGLREGGVCIVDADNPYYEGLVDAIRQRKPQVSIVTYGSSSSDTGQLLTSEFDNERLGWNVQARLNDEFLSYFLPLPHQHAPLASVGVLLTIKQSGYDAVRAAADFSGFQPYETMGHLVRLYKHGKELLFYDQSRRGGISGMRSAFSDIANIKVRGKVVALVGGVSVLRDSDWTKEVHGQLAELINNSPINHLYTTGNYMQYVTEHLHKQPIKHSEDLEELARFLVNDIEPGDLLFIIGSAYLYLGRVAEKVQQLLKQGSGAVAVSASPKSPVYRMLCAYQDVAKGVTAAKAVASQGVHYSDYQESLKSYATFTDFRAVLLTDFFHRMDSLLPEIRPMTCVNAEMAATAFNRYVVSQQFCRRWFNNFDKNSNLPTKQLFGSFYDFGDPELLLHVQVATVNLHIGFVCCRRTENGYVPGSMSEAEANQIGARMVTKGIKDLKYRTWGAKWLSVDLGSFIELTKPNVFMAMAETVDSELFARKIRPLVESLA